MKTRIRPVPDDQLTAQTRAIFQTIEKALGKVPNMHRTMAHAPAALRAFVDMNQALSGGALRPRVREQIALAVAAANGCQYCASAHTAIGTALGLAADELAANLHGESSDPKVGAALAFVRALVDRRGAVSDEELQALRAAGYGDGEIVEVVAHVALNTFTNLLNVLARTEVDFPLVRLAGAA